MTDFAHLAARMFGAPLLIDPAKASVLARVVGPRVFGGQVNLSGPSIAAPGDVEAPRPAASIIGDELYHDMVQRGGAYSRIGNIAVIPVAGTLVRRGGFVGAESGTTSYEGLSAQIRAARDDAQIAAIALEIDSFGGEAAGLFDMAAQIREVRKVKPVHAFVSDYALSAGYGIAAQADTITVPPYGLAGSIGVVVMHEDHSDQLAKEGVRITLVHSGAHKVEGNPFERLPEGVRAKMQADTDTLWAEFADQVSAGRKGRVSAADVLRMEAGVFRGAEAVSAGLADQVAEARAGFAALLDEYSQSIPGRAAAMSAPVTVSPAAATSLINGGITPGAAPATHAHGRQNGAAASQQKEVEMSKDITATADKAQPKPSDTPTVTPAVEAQAPSASVDAVGVERARCAKIAAKVAMAGLPASFGQELIAEGVSLEVAYDRIIDQKADAAQDGGDAISGRTTAKVTGDVVDRTCKGVELALMNKVRLDGGERNEFSGYTLREMARSVLAARGMTVHGGAVELASAAFAPMAAGGMHSTSDFGNILANIASKSMLKGFEEAPETFERFTSVGTLTDFKPTKRVGLDAFPSLSQVAEGAEFKYGTMGDRGEELVLATYGKLFAITRQTIINDDLDAFSKVPARMGRAAKRTVADLVFAILNGNPDMADGNALFHASHGNLAGSGAAPSEASINAAITAMASQTQAAGSETVKLNIAPKFLLAPPSLRSAVLQSLNSEYAPDDTAKSGTAKMSMAHNTVRDAAEPIFDNRLTGNAWYMAADASMHDGIEVSYLDGIDTPFLDQQDGWSVDGTEFKVRIDAAAKALAWQTLYKDPGA